MCTFVSPGKLTLPLDHSSDCKRELLISLHAHRHTLCIHRQTDRQTDTMSYTTAHNKRTHNDIKKPYIIIPPIATIGVATASAGHLAVKLQLITSRLQHSIVEVLEFHRTLSTNALFSEFASFSWRVAAFKHQYVNCF